MSGDSNNLFIQSSAQELLCKLHTLQLSLSIIYTHSSSLSLTNLFIHSSAQEPLCKLLLHTLQLSLSPVLSLSIIFSTPHSVSSIQLIHRLGTDLGLFSCQATPESVLIKLKVVTKEFGENKKMIKVEVIHKEIIKPSAPTPHHLRHLCLSLFDQIMLELHVPQVLFYPSSSDEHSLVAEKSELLKKSLSEALTIFYPFAGEFKNNVSINCDDREALFLEAQVNCPMSKILDKPDSEILTQLIPTPMRSKQAQVGHLVLVQANVFECGGLAIGVSISHKVADALANSNFIESWAEIARCTASSTDHHVVLPTEFGVVATLFPPQDFFKKNPITLPIIDNVVRKRLVFDASKIAALKAKAASATVPNPTRVKAVSALIWKSALEASRSNLRFARPSTWRSSVNLRKILAQPFAENLQGNFVFFTMTKIEENEVYDLQTLVAKMRKSVEEFKVKYANEIRGEEVVQFLKEYSELLQKDDMDNYICTSLCRFPFGSANFGWGKASCIRIPWNEDFKNKMLLLDASDGIGIDACITLKKEDMVMIETNQDLLAYASLQ